MRMNILSSVTGFSRWLCFRYILISSMSITGFWLQWLAVSLMKLSGFLILRCVLFDGFSSFTPEFFHWSIFPVFLNLINSFSLTLISSVFFFVGSCFIFEHEDETALILSYLLGFCIFFGCIYFCCAIIHE